jgi:uncharacterized protein YkwD
MGEEHSAPNGIFRRLSGLRCLRAPATGVLVLSAVAAVSACGGSTTSVVTVPAGQADLAVDSPQGSPSPADDGGGDGEQRDMAAGAGRGFITPSSGEGLSGRENAGAATPSGRARTPSRPSSVARSDAKRSSRLQTPIRRAVAPSPTTKGGTSSSAADPSASQGALLLLGPGVPTPDEAEVIRLVNVERIAAGCPALAAHPVLIQVARAHSQAMSVAGGFKHNSADGSTPFQRLRAVGYQYRVAGENIAAGQPTSAAVMKAWLDSPDHRKHLLDCRFTQIGVGKAHIPGSQYGTYWTQELAVPL